MELERSKLLLESVQNGDVEELRNLMDTEEADEFDEEFEEEFLMSSAVKISDNNHRSRKLRYRRFKTIFSIPDPVTGVIETPDPRKSSWYTCYVKFPQRGVTNFENTFKNRFRLSYNMFEALMHLVKESDCGKKYFQRWLGTGDATGQKSPIELLVLGSLRYLGRGWTFDDLQENTQISRELHRQFFHVFIAFGSTSLYNKFVTLPTETNMKNHFEVLQKAGQPACACFSDATNIVCEKVEHSLKNNHTGYKQSTTARTYNLTVTIERRIMNSTSGHPARWNDQSVSYFDNYIMSIKEGKLFNDHDFKLLERNLNGEIVEVKYKGVYLLVDNGYHKWVSLIPPMKVASKRSDVRWSMWVESLRKVVECTFGIMKGRFRILKAGVRLHGVEAADKIWLTCCALHNWLLDETSTETDQWDGVRGLFSEENVWRHIINTPLARIQNAPTMRDLRELQRYDSTSTGREGDTFSIEEVDEGRYNDENTLISNCGRVRIVRNLSFEFFRSRLIENFHIRFIERKDIFWPSGKKYMRCHQPTLL